MNRQLNLCAQPTKWNFTDGGTNHDSISTCTSFGSADLFKYRNKILWTLNIFLEKIPLNYIKIEIKQQNCERNCTVGQIITIPSDSSHIKAIQTVMDFILPLGSLINPSEMSENMKNMNLV